MTPEQLRQLQQDSDSDAEYLALLLVLALRSRRSAAASAVRNRVRWDAVRGYFLVDGRIVSFQSIRAYLSRIENKLGRRLLKVTTDLAEGRITIEKWQREFEKTIGTSHILAAALAVGGIGQALQNRLVISHIDEQLAYADNFVKEIKAGKAGSAARIRARAKSYLQQAHVIYVNARHDLIKTTGAFDECKRVLRAAESCPGCLKWFRKGWVPVAEQPRIGTLECRHYCRCYFIYRRTT